jgi:hypothetical protein
MPLFDSNDPRRPDAAVRYVSSRGEKGAKGDPGPPGPPGDPAALVASIADGQVVGRGDGQVVGIDVVDPAEFASVAMQAASATADVAEVIAELPTKANQADVDAALSSVATESDVTALASTREPVVVVPAEASEDDILAAVAALTAGTRVVFMGTYYELHVPLAIKAPRVRIDAARSTFRQLGVRVPVWDVQADDVEITWNVAQADPTTRYSYIADSGPSIRGGRPCSWSCAVWTSSHRGRFRGRVDGFYSGAVATAYNVAASSFYAEGDYRQDNRFDLEVSNVDFGVLYNGQERCETNLTGSYAAHPESINPPHMLYVAPGRTSIAGRGTGHASSGRGTGRVMAALRSAGTTGGTLTVTVNGQTTAPVPYNATKAQMTAAVEALSTVGTGNVYVHLTSGADVGVTGSGGGWFFVFGYGLGDRTLTVNGASLTGTAAGVAAHNFQPHDSGGAWRFRALKSGTYPALSADDCPGVLEVYDGTSDLHIGAVLSTRDHAPVGGSVITDSSVANLTVDSCKLHFAGPDARAVRLSGTDNSVRGVEITTQTTTVSSSSYVVVDGTRNTVEVEAIVNTGPGRWFGATLWPSSVGCTIRTRRLVGIGQIGVAISAGATTSFADVDPLGIEWHPSAAYPRTPTTDTSGNLTNRVRRGAVRRLLPGVVLPQSPGWTSVASTPVADRVYWQRLMLDEWMTLGSIGFTVTTAWANDDPVEVGLYDAAGIALWRSGAVTGKLNSVGAKSVTVPDTYKLLLPFTTYYLALLIKTPTGAAGQIAVASWSNSSPNTMTATAPPDIDGLTTASPTGLPSSAAGAVGGAGAVAQIIARTT